MPLGPGVRFRYTTTSGGKKLRLAFRGNKVIETKNPKTGAVHTPNEFADDRAHQKHTGFRRLRPTR